MSIPISKGIGTGAAQVYGQDKTFEALKGAANRKMQLDDYNKKLEEQRRLEEKQDNAKKQAGLNAIRDKIQFNPKGMKQADIDVSQSEYADFLKQWSGSFEDIYNGGAARNNFDAALAEFKGNVAKRVDSYSQIQKVSDRINANPNDYTEAQVDLVRDLLEDPNVDMGQYTGLLGKKINIGDVNSDYLKQYKDSFYEDEYSILTDKGRVSSKGGLKSDDETFEIFKGNLTPLWRQKINVMYGDNESLSRDSSGELTAEGTEQMLRNAHDTIKANLKPNKEIVNLTAKPDDSGDKTKTKYGEGGDVQLVTWNAGNKEGFVFSNPGNINIQPFKGEVKGDDGKVYAVDISPTNLSLKDGKWTLTGYATRTMYDKSGKPNVIKEDAQKILMDENGQFMSDIKNRFNIKGSLTNYYNKVNSSNNQDSDDLNPSK